MSIKFGEMSFKNFLSYGNAITTFDLNDKGTTMIGGVNGAGKTTIINAITYALYDNTISKIPKDLLVNNVNKKDMMVEVNFTIGNDEYYVERTRKCKGGNNVTFLKNGKNITASGITNTNDLIAKVLGIPFELFARIIIFSANNTSFLFLPAGTQVKLVEELFGITILSEKAAILKEEIRETFASRTIMVVKVEAEETIASSLVNDITTNNARIIKWEARQEKEIDVIKKSLDDIAGVDFDGERKLHKKLDNIIILKREEQLKLRTQGQLVKAQKTKIDKLERDIPALAENKCPYCKQQFADAKEKLVESNKELKILNKELRKLDKSVDKLSAGVEMIQLELENTANDITVKNLDTLMEIRENSSVLKERIILLKKEINPYLEVDSELNARLVDRGKVDYTDLNTIDKLAIHQQFLLKLLTKKDSFIRKSILSNNIPYLNKQINVYTKELGLPHKVSFNADLSTSISQFGREIIFGALSKGQSSRVNLALAFAFRDVLEHMHQKIDICVFDEVLDSGLDSGGIKMAGELIKMKSRTDDLSTFIISHRQDEISMIFEKNIKIEMVDGFSYINK